MFGRSIEKVKFRQITDGLSNTWMAGETLPSEMAHSCLWCPNFPLSSTNIPLNYPATRTANVANFKTASGFKSRHPGGANMLLGDGSVRFVSDEIDYFTWNEMGTTAGGEVLQPLED